MKLSVKLIAISLLAMFTSVSCSDGPETESPGGGGTEPGKPKVVLVQAPDEWDAGETIEIIAQVTIEEGTIASVKLVYNDGSDHNVAMTATSDENQYSASLTVPSTVGETIEYYVEATGDEDKTTQSETITLTAAEEGTTTSLAKKLRLNEVGTYEGSKFIELYNPTGISVSLEGVSLWKNGELLHEFTASQKLWARNYGVLKAKGTTVDLTSGGVELGTTDIGLSGSKSLSIELRLNGTAIDAFANTINPGVADMTIDDWDGKVEHAGLDLATFIRKNGETTGWYGVAVNTGNTTQGTPGTANGTAGTRLNHQLFAVDAVASDPYIANIVINPDTPTVGLTVGTNVIRFNAYSDVHSTLSSVTCSAGSVTNVEGSLYEVVAPFTSGAAAGTDTSVTMTAVNGLGGYTEKITVTVFPAGQSFGSYSDICINEIQTSTKDGIELYNKSSNPVVIAGMRIRKNKDSIFIIPGYITMKGNGFAVLGCNDNDYTPGAGDKYLYLGSVSNGLSGSKSLLIELRKPKIEGDLTNSVNIDSFVNISLSETAPNKDSEWDKENYVEKVMSRGAGRKPDGNASFILFSDDYTSMGSSNSASQTTGTAFTQKYTQDESSE